MITKAQPVDKQGICSFPHTPPISRWLRLCVLRAVQSSPRSAFIPTLTEALERGTSRLSG